jgi:tRNA pseudouridine55 synthase
MTDGLVVVDKPAGFTSHDVVAKLRKAYGQKRVGHAGTLDPDATGVLLVGLGRLTRLLRFLQVAAKSYRATVRFGVATSTLDAAGEVIDRQAMAITREDVERVAVGFVGDIEQVPPMVSAIKIGGRRLHELAREGTVVERAARPVHVSRLEVEAFEPGPYPLATVLVDCSTGTYVRTLAADLGTALGGCAHVETLRRLQVGSFTLDEARPLAAIEEDPAAAVVPAATAMRDLERVEIDEEVSRTVRHGMTFAATALGESGEGPFAVIGPGDELLAVYERDGDGLKPAVVIGVPTASEA